MNSPVTDSVERSVDTAPVTGRSLLWAAGMGAAALVVAAVGASLVGQAELTWNIWLSRLPRILAAMIVGASLAVGGTSLQAQLRNPLAEPYLLGISSGAGVGVLAGMAVAQGWAMPVWATTPVLAFFGAILTCAAVYLVAQRHGRLDPYSLILSGVIINAFNAAVLMVFHLYLDPHRIADFARWSMGRLTGAVAWDLLLACGVFVLAGWGRLLLRAASMNALALGDDVASSAGVGVHRLRLEVFALVGLMTAAAVALAGPIGFVGLIIPHFCRLLVGTDQRRLLIVAGFVGAVFLVVVDSVCRTAGRWIGTGEIPVGVITALMGGPFFLALLRRRMREVAQ